MNSGRARLLSILALVAGMTVSWPPDARSFNSGAHSNPNCSGCHSGPTAPTVIFMLKNAAVTTLAVPRGSTVPLTLRLKSTQAQKNTGFNVASSNSAVTLGVVADPGTQIIPPGEVTHTSRRVTNAQGIADFPFKITAGSGAACGSAATLKGQALATSAAPVTGGKANTATLAVTVTCQ